VIAAIYARKSNEVDVAEEQKSVVSQIEGATAFIASKGWTLGPECVFVDDGISGAEFKNRPSFVRMLNSLEPKPKFDVLVVRDLDRIGRDQQYGQAAMYKIAEAGVKVWEYVSGAEVPLEGAMNQIYLGLKFGFAALEIEKTSERVTDKMIQKFLRGEAVGAPAFGYRSVYILRKPDAQGNDRSYEPVAKELLHHALHEINPEQAAVVTRIFELTRDGLGRERIAKLLNREGIKSAKGNTWDKAVIRHVLNRDVYHGQTAYGTIKRGHKNGTAKSIKRVAPLATLARPELQIISDELWAATQGARQSREVNQLRGTDGKLSGHPSASSWLLTKLSRCGKCGGALYVKESGKRKDGSKKAEYRCGKSRSGRCDNLTGYPVKETDSAILSLVEAEVLQPDVLERTLDAELADAGQIAVDRERVSVELQAIQTDLDKLVKALLAGAGVETITAALKERETVKQTLQAQAEHLDGKAKASQIDRVALRASIADWREKLSDNPIIARQVLGRVLTSRLTFQPNGDIHGEATFGQLIRSGWVPAYADRGQKGTSGRPSNPICPSVASFTFEGKVSTCKHATVEADFVTV